jgi:molybdenum cofactor guanylyltransferase
MKFSRTPFAIAILAGGASRRMGQDKASLTVDGVTLLERTIQVAAGIGPMGIFIVGRDAPRNETPIPAVYLPDPDGRQGEGPLAGIVTALEKAKAEEIPGVLAIPCDMPHLTAEALQWLAETAQKSDSGEHGIAAQVTEGQPEPLFAVYKTEALSFLQDRLTAGERSPRRAILRGRFVLASVPGEIVPFLRSVNTPEEWKAATEQGIMRP